MFAAILFTTCLAGAIVPGLGSEVLVLGTAVLTDGPMLTALIVLAAAAQAMGKLLVYAAAATGARSETGSRFGLDPLHAALSRSRNQATAIVFASALTSVPPLYATTIVCGAARLGPARFGLAAFTARVLRYAMLVAILDPVRTVL